MVVLPAASNPTIKMRISCLPTNRCQIFVKAKPILSSGEEVLWLGTLCSRTEKRAEGGELLEP
eukprot:CAMPEP_0206507020 /NCGR_PEP_ID=MMETSP0324_2-20121206/57230_1 /ASSEMBLY_ACC=CAM_ASM_000836 /TAXON_ID=2866 /ORGANISM="Crypthecodinium cohnii, Strain Seligo" /LENGTH=62 /DNA_ID=CAMNT_0053997097 /DNA_START=12 /DNA_END=196 /DNA_ORIENTATION=-